MMPPEFDHQRGLLKILAAQDTVSADELAAKLSLSRDDILTAVSDLQGLGVPLNTDKHGNCRLDAELELLDADTLRALLPTTVHASLASMQLHWQTDSTNQRLLELPAPPPARARLCLAEYQWAGRGRHGRSWQAPFGGSVCLSVAWTFPRAMPEVAGLGIAMGVAVRAALDQCGIPGVQLKWPNDLLWGQRKLGGLLLEMRTGQDAATTVVAGIGLNYALDESSRAAIERLGGLAPVDAGEASSGDRPGRNQLAAQVVTHVVHALTRFASSGLEPFLMDWRAADAYRDQPVRVSMPNRDLAGVARGIDASGALRLETDGRIERIISAEVSLRPA